MDLATAVVTSKTWLSESWMKWRGSICAFIVFIVFVLLSFRYAPDISEWMSPKSNTGSSAAIVIVMVFGAFLLGLIVTFFGIFRGIKADEDQLKSIITYCYAFIVFSLLSSVMPFIALPLIPDLYDNMTKSPIGIVAGCSVAAGPDRTGTDKPGAADADKTGATAPERTGLRFEEKAVPNELRCDTNTDQWVVNIGGTISSNTAVPVPDENNKKYRMVKIRGGLVVPLYAIVLSLMGAAVSMTRRVPELQRRLSPGDPEYINFDQAREGLVFQIMQVASAPLIAVTAYYLVDPGSKAGTIVLSFASGFSSETVLLLIRATLEKLRPVSSVHAPKSPTVGVAPARLDFGSVPVGTTVRKAVSISNPGPAPLIVSVITCGGEFSTPTPVPLNVAPSASSVIAVDFKPVTAGAKQDQLTITDNATGSPRTVDLTGNGA